MDSSEVSGWQWALTRARENCLVLGRALVALFLRVLGLLNIGPLLRGHGHGGPTVVFQTFSAHLAQCYEPIITQLRSEAPELHLQCMIVLHPHVPFGEVRELRKYVREELKFPDADVFFYWQRMWGAFDLLVCGDIFAPFPIRRPRTILLPHGTGLMPRMFEPHPLRKSMADFDRVLLAGPYDVEAVRQHPRAKNILPRVVSVGFPFLDRLRKPRITRDQYFSDLGLDPALPTVLFAPHWTALKSAGAVRHVEEIVDALKTLDANLIVKLHACSFYPAMARGVVWGPRLEKLAQDRRVHVDYGLDDLPALGYSDILMTDFSSRAFVFMTLEKPVVLCSPAGADPLEETGERMDLMRSASFVASSTAQVGEIVGGLLRNRTAHPAGRSVSEKCFENALQATQPAVDLIRAELAA